MPVMVCSAPVDVYIAQQIAENFIATTDDGTTTQAHQTSRHLRRMLHQNDETFSNQQYYIFNREDSCGFVIVAADNCATPILGYSTEGYIDINNMPIQLKELLQAYTDEIQYSVDNNLQPSDSIKELWNDYLNAPQNHKATMAVSALIATKWNQSPLYNDKCPADASLSPYGGHPTTGCVATAMAQIMKYWEYPETGTGNKSYNSEHYGTLSANFANTTYDWKNMPTQLSTSSTSTQVDAIATLMYHCGVAVSMNYNSDGNGSSGALLLEGIFGRASAEKAYKTYFDYATTVEGKQWMSSTSTTTWKNMLKTELDNKRPVLYGGFTKNGGGHAFICDGYDSNDNFHFNWGWGGLANGFFSLTALTAGGYNYSTNQQAVIGIQPKNGSATPKNYALYMNSDLVTNNTYSSNTFLFGKELSFSAKVENNGTGTFAGSFRVAIFSSSGEFLAWSKEKYHFSLSAGHNTVLKTYTFDGGIPFIPGKYRAYMYYKDDNEDVWYSVKTDVGIILTEYNNVAFTIKSTSDLQPVSDFTIQKGDLIVGSTIRISVDVKNTAYFTAFYGKIRLCLYDSEGKRALIIDELDYSKGFSTRTTKTLSFTGVVDVEPGTYYLALTFKESDQTTWYYMGCDVTYPNPVSVIVKAPKVYADVYEINNTQNTASMLYWEIDPEISDFSTDQVSLHEASDIDYYKLDFSKANKYKVNISLYDKYNQGGLWYENADAQFAYSVGGTTYSEYYKNNKSITFNGPTTLYIKVVHYESDGLGYYELSGEIEETIKSDIEEITTINEPSKFIHNGQLFIQNDGKKYNISGNLIK